MELTNKTLNLDVQKEYQNEKFVLSGIRQIRLGYLPAGVKIWISTENTGDNLYSLDVKGDGWKDLPEPLYDLYITTKGTSQEKLVLYYSGESSDYYAVGNATTEQVNRVNSIEAFSPNLLTQLCSLAGANRTDNILYANFINGSFSHVMPTKQTAGTCIFVNKTLDFSTLNFKVTHNYLIELQGHIDFGGLDTTEDLDSHSAKTTSLHLNLFNISTLDLSTFTDLSASYPNISNLYFKYDDVEIETISNHATLFGAKRYYSFATTAVGNTYTRYQLVSSYMPTDMNPNKTILINGGIVKNLNYLLLSVKMRFRIVTSEKTAIAPTCGVHYGFKIVIRELQNIAGQPTITTLPYINNNINLPDLGAV